MLTNRGILKELGDSPSYICIELVLLVISFTPVVVRVSDTAAKVIIIAMACSYKKEVERLVQLYNEVVTDEELDIGDCDSDISDVEGNAAVQVEDHISEESGSEEDDLESVARYVGRDNSTTWSKHPLAAKTSRTRKKNLVTQLPGAVRNARQVTDILESWQLFFPDSMLQKIVKYTNIKINQVRPNYSRERDAKETDIVELKAFFGLLYLAGVNRSNHQNLLDLWRTDGTGVEMFRLVMGVNRFRFLIQMLRFDDISDTQRTERKKLDKLTYIREIFEEFVIYCKNNYNLGSYVTVDEMLPAFRGRCSFKVYMPMKPDKYGIKIWACTDAKTLYCSNLEVFVGLQQEGPYRLDNRPDEVVKRLVNHLSGSGRNITCDNYFTSIKLAKDLLDMRLTVVGTIRKNKREIPPILTANLKERPVRSSIFGFSKDLTIVSYKAKKNKFVLLLSTQHDEDSIDPSSGEAHKPDIVTFYNRTKSGVDANDELQKSYSVSRVSNRWPLTIFFTIMNIGAINSYIIFRSNTNSKRPRSDYLRELAKSLMKDYAIRKVLGKTTSYVTKIRLREIFGIEAVDEEVETSETRCNYCPRSKNRKTKTRCCKCRKPICRQHTIFTCTDCHAENLD